MKQFIYLTSKNGKETSQTHPTTKQWGNHKTILFWCIEEEIKNNDLTDHGNRMFSYELTEIETKDGTRENGVKKRYLKVVWYGINNDLLITYMKDAENEHTNETNTTIINDVRPDEIRELTNAFITLKEKGTRERTKTALQDEKEQNRNNITEEEKTTATADEIEQHPKYNIMFNRTGHPLESYLMDTAETITEVINILNELINSITADDIGTAGDYLAIEIINNTSNEEEPQ